MLCSINIRTKSELHLVSNCGPFYTNTMCRLEDWHLVRQHFHQVQRLTESIHQLWRISYLSFTRTHNLDLWLTYYWGTGTTNLTSYDLSLSFSSCKPKHTLLFKCANFQVFRKDISSETDDRLTIFIIYDAFSNGASWGLMTLTFDLKTTLGTSTTNLHFLWKSNY